MGARYTEHQIRSAIEYFNENRGIENGLTRDEMLDHFCPARTIRDLKKPEEWPQRFVRKVRWYTDLMDSLCIHNTYSSDREAHVYYSPANEHEHDIGQLEKLKQIAPRANHFEIDEERASRMFRDREPVSISGAVGAVGRVKDLLDRSVSAVKNVLGVAS